MSLLVRSDSSTAAERLTKYAALAAIAVALPLHVWVDPAVGWLLRGALAVAFTGALATGRLWPEKAVLGVVVAGPVLPVLLAVSVHVAALNVFYSVWLAALFGALLARCPHDRWALPIHWRVPLAMWGLVVAVSWPVMIVREAGLRLGTLRDTGAIDTWAGLSTPQVESWILHVALAQLVGLLWLEWVVSRPEESRRAAHGIWIGTSIASAVAVFQGTVDLSFLSAPPWPALGRSAGTLLDANAYGTIAAIAAPLGVVSIARLELRRPGPLQAGVLALNWSGVWMSGSRTALLCGVIGTAALALALLRGNGRDHGLRVRPAWLLGGAAIGLLLVLAAGAGGPLRRFSEGIDTQASFRQLWTRGGYGTVATRMVRDYPLTGVGVGSFNWMAPDYWRTMTGETLPFDNAQNWWRHQVAELGILASLPLLIWSAMVLWLVVTRIPSSEARVEAETLRGLLVGLGAASLLGMPTQNPLVLVAFFYLVGRFHLLTSVSESASTSRVDRQYGRGPQGGVWALGILLAIGYAAGHLALARSSLRPAERAARAGRSYIVGTYPPEPQANGEFRWTRERATFVLPASSGLLLIRHHVEHPDASTLPVQIRIATPCQTLADEALSDSSTRTTAVELHPGQTSVTFTTEVSRTWRPASVGLPDPRELGVAVETAFVPEGERLDASSEWIPLRACGPV